MDIPPAGVHWFPCQAAASHEACRNVISFLFPTLQSLKVDEQVRKGRDGTDPMPDDLRKGGLESQARVQVSHRPGTKQSLPPSSPPVPPIRCFYTLNQNIMFYTQVIQAKKKIHHSCPEQPVCTVQAL